MTDLVTFVHDVVNSAGGIVNEEEVRLAIAKVFDWLESEASIGIQSEEVIPIQRFLRITRKEALSE